MPAVKGHRLARTLSAALLAAGAILLSPVAAAQDNADAEPAKADPLAFLDEVEDTNPNRKICTRVKPTGSHIRQRVCLRRKEWEAMRASSSRALRENAPVPVGSPSS